VTWLLPTALAVVAAVSLGVAVVEIWRHW
jgi:hypothetical protein